MEEVEFDERVSNWVQRLRRSYDGEVLVEISNFFEDHNEVEFAEAFDGLRDRLDMIKLSTLTYSHVG